MKVCPSCENDSYSYELDEDCKLIPECLVCGRKGEPVESDPDLPRNVLSRGTVPDTDGAKKAPVAAKGQPAKGKSRPFNVLQAAKARLRELAKEIARLEKLKSERDELKRLVAAAQKPATVVALRKSG